MKRLLKGEGGAAERQSRRRRRRGLVELLRGVAWGRPAAEATLAAALRAADTVLANDAGCAEAAMSEAAAVGGTGGELATAAAGLAFGAAVRAGRGSTEASVCLLARV